MRKLLISALLGLMLVSNYLPASAEEREESEILYFLKTYFFYSSATDVCDNAHVEEFRTIPFYVMFEKAFSSKYLSPENKNSPYIHLYIEWDKLHIVVDNSSPGMKLSHEGTIKNLELENLTLFVPTDADKRRWEEAGRKQNLELDKIFAKCRQDYLEMKAKAAKEREIEVKRLENIMAGKEVVLVYPE